MILRVELNYAHKVAKTLFVLHETWHIHYLVYIILLKWVELKIIDICLKLRGKLRFEAFLSVFGTFAHNVAQTLFVLHETWHTTLFGIHYFFEILRIANHSHMLENTC